MNILKIAGLAALLVAWTSGWGQTYYKWTDDEGTTHFTSAPPQDRDYETVRTSVNVISRPAPSAEETSDRDNAEEQNGMDEEVQMPREREPDPEQVEARCAQAQENLFWLQNRRRIEVERSDGTVEFVEGEAREAMIAETQSFIDEWCSEDG